MIEVENTLRTYEENGVETPVDMPQTIGIKSHWNTNRYIIISIPMGLTKKITEEAVAKGKSAVEITVSAEDLEHAVVNATNTK